ncbi:sensor histidine kinase [Micromonospora ureilytica]|uniref:histidine kinase n=1 Tax=Micromonospora ureilytica TaxID=709868 RepID=A0ABS0JP62_9ACTN|nr:histidine kinase [Micromonospora ureilytica]MBG6068610.1 signal transduction histidine kinase [Micromonospora ureilytica]
MASSAVALRRVVQRYGPMLLAVVVAAAVWASAAGDLGVRSPLPSAVVLLIVLGSAWAAGTVRTRLWPLFLAAAVGWLVLAAAAAGVLASYQAGLRLRGRQLAGYLAGAALVLGGGVLVGLAVGGVRRITTAATGNVLLLAACLVGLPLVFGLWVRARQDTLAALRDRAERLEREQEARADRVRAEERTRIAREMHDVVAHRVSLMVVHAGALEVTAVDPATVEAAALIRTTGRQALTDLRAVLGVLRQAGPAVTPERGLDALDELIGESRAAGLRVSRQDEGVPTALPATLGRTAYRVVREALTNVRKHAADAETTVCLRYLPDGLEVLVRNGPSEGGSTLPGAGQGLLGLRERVELLGGRLEATPVDGGFLVRALIPLAVVA